MRLATENFVDSAIDAIPPPTSTTLPNFDDAIAALSPNSHWKLDEKTGLFLDSGPSNRPATYVSGTRNQRSFRPHSKAVWDAGDAAIATIGNFYKFLGRQPFTALGVHYLQSEGAANSTMLDNRNAAVNAGWCLGYQGTLGWIARLPGGSITVAGGYMSDWNLVIGSYTGTNLNIYINGNFASVADVADQADSATPLQINGWPGGGTFGARGKYDTIAIWDGVALTQAQMDSIWDTL